MRKGFIQRAIDFARTMVPSVPFGRVRTVVRHSYTNWSPERVNNALRAHEQGKFDRSAQLGETMRRDSRVFATLESIVSACLAGERIVDGSKSKTRQQAVEAWIWRTLKHSVLADLVRNEVLYGFAIAELAWHKSELDGLLYPTVRVLSCADVRFNLTDNRFYFRGAMGEEHLIEPGDGRWLLFTRGATDSPFLNGAIRAIAMPWMIRTDVITYWMRRTELESSGAKKAKVPAGSDADAAKVFVDAVRDMGAESTVVVPTDYDLEYVKTDLNSTTNFAALVDRQDTAITLAILRQNLTTQIEGGSFASAQVHAKVLQDNARSILSCLENFTREQIINVWGKLNFEDWPSDERMSARIDIRPTIDKQQEAQALNSLAQALNSLRSYGVQTDSTLKKFGLEVDEEKSTDYGQIFAYHIQSGIFTINEIRASLGYPPTVGGDKFPEAQSAKLTE